MSAPATAGAWRLERFDELGSTSDLCRARAEAGEPDGLAVLAGRQTSGRGSRGRHWDSPSGNLYLSVLLRPHGAARDAGEWALVAGVALADAFAPLLPDPRALTLKWPNDLLLGGAKLAGILLDSATDGQGGIAWLVIGMGANLVAAPAIPGRRTACVAAIAVPPDPAEMAIRVLAHLARWRDVRAAEGFAPVAAAWLARAQPLGAPMTLRMGGREIAGHFAGLGAGGTLRLTSDGTVRTYTTGEVLLADMA